MKKLLLFLLLNILYTNIIKAEIKDFIVFSVTPPDNAFSKGLYNDANYDFSGIKDFNINYLLNPTLYINNEGTALFRNYNFIGARPYDLNTSEYNNYLKYFGDTIVEGKTFYAYRVSKYKNDYIDFKSLYDAQDFQSNCSDDYILCSRIRFFIKTFDKKYNIFFLKGVKGSEIKEAYEYTYSNGLVQDNNKYRSNSNYIEPYYVYFHSNFDFSNINLNQNLKFIEDMFFIRIYNNKMFSSLYILTMCHFTTYAGNSNCKPLNSIYEFYNESKRDVYFPKYLYPYEPVTSSLAGDDPNLLWGN